MPILSANALEFFSRSPEQTRRLGARLGTLLSAGDVVCLSGDLGSGKTTFVKGVAQGWGSLDEVTSPTFVLVNYYSRPQGETLYHLDAYRLEGADEAEALDMDWMLDSGALVVEWPERIKRALPAECLWVTLRYVDDLQRGMVFQSEGSRYNTLLAEFRKQAFGG